MFRKKYQLKKALRNCATQPWPHLTFKEVMAHYDMEIAQDLARKGKLSPVEAAILDMAGAMQAGRAIIREWDRRKEGGSPYDNSLDNAYQRCLDSILRYKVDTRLRVEGTESAEWVMLISDRLSAELASFNEVGGAAQNSFGDAEAIRISSAHCHPRQVEALGKLAQYHLDRALQYPGQSLERRAAEMMVALGEKLLTLGRPEQAKAYYDLARQSCPVSDWHGSSALVQGKRLHVLLGDPMPVATSKLAELVEGCRVRAGLGSPLPIMVYWFNAMQNAYAPEAAQELARDGDAETVTILEMAGLVRRVYNLARRDYGITDMLPLDRAANETAAQCRDRLAAIGADKKRSESVQRLASACVEQCDQIESLRAAIPLPPRHAAPEESRARLALQAGGTAADIFFTAAMDRPELFAQAHEEHCHGNRQGVRSGALVPNGAASCPG